MSDHDKLASVLVGSVILMIVLSTLMIVNYTTGVLNAAVDFASSDQADKFTNCGMTVPPELFKLKADIPSFILPAIYVGLPGLMILIAILMFIAGYYYNSGGGMKRQNSSTTTTTSRPNRSATGRYKPGRNVQQTQTRRSSERNSRN